MAHSLLIVGSADVGRLESSYARAFQHLGWAVHFWDPRESLQRVARGYRLGRIFSAFVNVEPWIRKANLHLLQTVDERRPRLILLIGTHGVWPGTLAQIRALVPGILIYCIFPDTPHNLASDRMLCFPFCDRVATVSPGWVDAFVRLGAPRVDYLPLAADTDLHLPSPPLSIGANTTYSHDVLFVGNWRADREEFLEQLINFDLQVWGTDYWQRRTRPASPLRSRWGGRPLGSDEFSLACAQGKILLNIIDIVGWPGPNMRTFEQPACGAFSLVSRTPAITSLFKEGETIECFASVGEAQEKIRYYLNHEDERQKIAKACYEFVVNGGHTYLDRAKQLVDWAAEDGAIIDAD